MITSRIDKRHGAKNDAYFKAHQRRWQFIKDYQRDSEYPEYHGLYQMVGEDGRLRISGKGRIWKATYHDGRALLNVTERLRTLAESSTR